MPAQVTTVVSGDTLTGKFAGAKSPRPITIDNLFKAVPVPRGLKAGASTAAAGTTTADAGVLPAGTAPAYPTTAADGTKGVRINAADKVDGRLIVVTNGAAAVLKIYPPSGGTINNAAADAAFSTASGRGAILYLASATANAWMAWS